MHQNLVGATGVVACGATGDGERVVASDEVCGTHAGVKVNAADGERGCGWCIAAVNDEGLVYRGFNDIA